MKDSGIPFKRILVRICSLYAYISGERELDNICPNYALHQCNKKRCYVMKICKWGCEFPLLIVLEEMMILLSLSHNF